MGSPDPFSHHSVLPVYSSLSLTISPTTVLSATVRLIQDLAFPVPILCPVSTHSFFMGIFFQNTQSISIQGPNITNQTFLTYPLLS